MKVAMLVIMTALTAAGCGSAPDDEGEERLRAGLRRLLGRTEALVARAVSFDQDAVLRGLGTSPFNGPFVRLENLIGTAQAVGDRSPAGVEDPCLLCLELDGSDPIRLTVRDGDPANLTTTGRGILWRTVSGCTLGTHRQIDLQAATIGSVFVRARATARRRLTLTVQGDAAALSVDVDLAEDGRFHDYEVDLASSLESLSPGRVRSLVVELSRGIEAADEIEIDHVRLLSRHARYAHGRYGAGHEALDGELRPAIWMWTPTALRFAVAAFTGEPARLEFGTGVAGLASGATFSVRLEENGQSRQVFSHTAGRGTGWTDWSVELVGLGRGPLTVVLEASGDAGEVALWSSPVLLAPRRDRFNVVVVLEDALRADHLSAYGYHRPTTPVKDQWIRRGALFRNAYSQATKTRFSCPSFMTSLYPTASGVLGIWNLHARLHSAYLTLAEVMRSQGFATAAFLQNANAGPGAGLHQGFDSVAMDVRGGTQEMYTGEPMRWIEDHRDRNFFVYLHVADPHEPYRPSGDFRSWYHDLLTGAGRPDWHDHEFVTLARRALYDGEVRGNDAWFARFIARLDELGLAEDTLVVFVADHGEHLGEHGRWSHNPPSYVQVTHVPLLMVYPRRISPALVAEQVVQNVDVMPTILDLAGVDCSRLLLQGDSLVPLLEGRDQDVWNLRAAYVEEALWMRSRDDQRHLASLFSDRWHVMTSPGRGLVAFDLRHDPQERSPRRITRRLSRDVETAVRNLKRNNVEIWRLLTGGDDSAVQLDPDAVHNLKALGYIDP